MFGDLYVWTSLHAMLNIHGGDNESLFTILHICCPFMKGVNLIRVAIQEGPQLFSSKKKTINIMTEVVMNVMVCA